MTWMPVTSASCASVSASAWLSEYVVGVAPRVRMTVVVVVPPGTVIDTMSERLTKSNGCVPSVGSARSRWSTRVTELFVAVSVIRAVGKYWGSVPTGGMPSGPPDQSFDVVTPMGRSRMRIVSAATPSVTTALVASRIATRALLSTWPNSAVLYRVSRVRPSTGSPLERRSSRTSKTRSSRRSVKTDEATPEPLAGASGVLDEGFARFGFSMTTKRTPTALSRSNCESVYPGKRP